MRAELVVRNPTVMEVKLMSANKHMSTHSHFPMQIPKIKIFCDFILIIKILKNCLKICIVQFKNSIDIINIKYKYQR